jgi:hypothetical protein
MVRAAETKVDALVQALGRARATAVVEEREPRLDNPMRLVFDGVAQGLFAADRVARADGVVLRFVPPADLSLVRAPATTYYERRLFPLRLDDIVAADVGPLELRRENAMWRVIAPPAAVGPAKDEAVRAWLEPLLSAEAHSFSTEAPSHGVRIRLCTRDDEISAVVAGTRARRNGETLTVELTTPLVPSTDATGLRGSP